MEEGRAASPPPLLAYTTSHQQSGRGKDRKQGNRAQKPSRQQQQQQQQQQRQRTTTPRRQRKEAPVVFDEEARREYLTGFHKRKQARIEHGRERARLREKEERRQMRQEARKAKKEQAAENVRAEKRAYGGDSEDEESDSEHGQAGVYDDDAPSPSAYETEEHHTTVTVQAWDPEADEEGGGVIGGRSSRSAPRVAKKDTLPPSSRRMAKKLKSDEAQRQRERVAQKLAPKNTLDARGKKRQSASAITDLLDDGIDVSDSKVQGNTSSTQTSRPAPDSAVHAATTKASHPSTKKPFRYESKLDRAKAKAAQKESNAKFAQKRKEAAILNGGRKTSKGGPKSGKGGKGKAGKGGKSKGGKR